MRSAMSTTTTTSEIAHPTRFSPAVLAVVRELIPDRGQRMLDPFAGTGRALDLYRRSIGVEIEHEWAAMHEHCIVGDATALPFADGVFDLVVTSPCYGNRFADHHNAKDGSIRHSYRHDLGRPLHSNNAGRMQWGDEYRWTHVEAWLEVRRVLDRFGWFVLNVSDHVRRKERVRVSAWHVETIRSLGFVLADVRQVQTKRLRYGDNRDRADCEFVFVFEHGASGATIT